MEGEQVPEGVNPQAVKKLPPQLIAKEDRPPTPPPAPAPAPVPSIEPRVSAWEWIRLKVFCGTPRSLTEAFVQDG